MKTAVALVVVVLSFALPGVALAGTASFDPAPSALGPGTVVNLHYRADSGERNRLSVRFDGSTTYTLVDPVGITAGANCSHPNPSDNTRVTCVQPTPSSTRIGTLVIRLGDRDDRAALSGHGGAVLGGGGSDVLKGSEFADTLSAGDSTSKPTGAHTGDRLSGGNGGDRLLGSGGANRISGGRGHDVILAGRGGDRISARDRQVDQVRCGGGADVAKLDTADYLGDNCRRVSRPGTPAATPIDLFTAGSSAFVVVGCPADSVLSRCVGTVRISRGRRSLGSKGFDIARGHKANEGIRLPRDIRRQIGPNGGPKVRVTVRSRSRVNLTSTFITRRRLPPPGD